jgi:hypothetical protein
MMTASRSDVPPCMGAGFLNPAAGFNVNSFPYDYVVIQNVFHEHMAQALELVFEKVIAGGKSIGKVGEVGELIYDAINYTPTLWDMRNTPLAVFASPELRTFLAGLFDLQVDENMMIGMHRHNPPSKAGWPHTDFAVVSYPRDPPNVGPFRFFYNGSPCNYSDDSRDRQPDSIKTARAIACLYYIGNDPDWREGMGGETGIYCDRAATLLDKVPPRNNSLFAFAINPFSYHAYLGSAEMRRNSIIWWYHAPPSYLRRRYAPLFEKKLRMKLDPWDRWTELTVAKYEVEE